MRNEVLSIIRKEWPDKTSPKGRVRYGALDLFSALAKLTRYAQDIGDDELYEEAYEEAKKVKDPTPDREGKFCYSLFGIRNQEHDAIHNKKPRIFIFKEKHGDCIFDASTPEASSKAVLYMLECRLEDGWLMDELPEDEQVSNQMDLLSSNEIPETEAGKARRILKIARSDKPGCLLIAGKMAYTMLMERSGYEYELFDIEYLSEAEFDLKKEPQF
jgi:hypothetical protein